MAQEASHEGPSPPAARRTPATPYAASGEACWLFSEILRPNLSLEFPGSPQGIRGLSHTRLPR